MIGGCSIEVLDLHTFGEQREHYDRLVWQTPGIDRFCSSSAWILAAQAAFHKDAEILIFKGRHGYVPLLSMPMPEWGKLLLPMEASWFLSCPVVSAKPRALIEELVDYLARGEQSWDALLLGGFMEGSPVYVEILRSFMRGYHLYHGPSVTRCIADLKGGVEGFLSRRTRKFRKNLRRTERQMAEMALSFQWLNQPMDGDVQKAVYARIQDVESRCWKGMSGVGINQGDMQTFYRELMGLQGPGAMIRVGFAKQGPYDMGYILGAVMGGVYRGYQFSFDERMRTSGLGNWMQMQAIETLCREGVRYYDLGTDMAYKQQWSEFPFETVSFIISKRER